MTDAWGVVDGYLDSERIWRPTSPETRRAIHDVMGVHPDAVPPPGADVRVVRAGEAACLDGPADLILEDGTERTIDSCLPDDLPPGYHVLRPREGASPVLLIVTPWRCFLPERLFAWGWAVQLYAARSAESWGVGDLADLRRLGRWSAGDLGAGALLLNPLGAPTPTAPVDPSPYRTSSRRYLSPLYLRVEEVPGAADTGADLARLAALGRALNARRRIDHEAVLSLKTGALEALWARFGGDEDFERYCAAEGTALREFATFCALAEHHRATWHGWPEEHRRPDAAGVARFAAARADRVRFHQWVQWLLDRQLARAASSIALLHDLPIGVDPDGGDAWAWQDVLALHASIGSPPDPFNPRGQQWGLPPFVPHRLRAAGYRPLIETLRASLRHAGGLRIDHVMGLFRLFWVPAAVSAADGTYVRYRPEELLAILAIESHRAGAIVVGEDLGTVEDGVREELAERQILSYRVLWFEPEPPACYPRLSVAAVTTHDLPTIAGLWTGADLQHQREAGVEPNAAGEQEMRARLQSVDGVAADTSAEDVIRRTHERLAEAPSLITLATLDDALAVTERPNIPGTTTAVRPNWSLALPQPLEDLERHPLALAVARALGRHAAGRGRADRS